MRVIAKSTLRKFWETSTYQDAQGPPSSLSDFPLHREILTTVIAELRRSP